MLYFPTIFFIVMLGSIHPSLLSLWVTCKPFEAILLHKTPHQLLSMQIKLFLNIGIAYFNYYWFSFCFTNFLPSCGNYSHHSLRCMQMQMKIISYILFFITVRQTSFDGCGIYMGSIVGWPALDVRVPSLMLSA